MAHDPTAVAGGAAEVLGHVWVWLHHSEWFPVHLTGSWVVAAASQREDRCPLVSAAADVFHAHGHDGYGCSIWLGEPRLLTTAAAGAK